MEKEGEENKNPPKVRVSDMARKCPRSARKAARSAYKDCVTKGGHDCRKEATRAYNEECRGELPYGKIILGAGVLAAAGYMIYKVRQP